jgi:hypothetical protein
MPDPAEEFGAGIPVPATGAAPTQGAPVTTANLPRAMIEQLKSKNLLIPDEWTDESLVENLLEQQRLAQEAETLRAENEQFKAAQAQQLAKQVATEQQKVAEDEFALPWKPVKADRALAQLVKVDPQTGMYVPTNPTSVAHIKAAEQMNERAQYAQQFLEAYIDDPVGTTELLTKKQVAAIKKEFADELAALKEQFTPLQAQAKVNEERQELGEFCQKHAAKLFINGVDGEVTPLGALVDDMYLEDGIPLEDALAKAEKRLAKMNPQVAAPAQPRKKESISKVANPVEAPNRSRFVDGLSRGSLERMEEDASGDGKRQKPMTIADLDRKYGLRRN